MTAPADRELHAVLLNLAGDTLLLPNAAIHEVQSAERLRPAALGSGPAWLAGHLPHEDRLLPVVRFEVLNGGHAGEDGRRTRVAILHAIGGRVARGRYGLLCQGHPHLVMLNRAALRAESLHASDDASAALARVRIANASALIPNLEYIESGLVQLDERR